VEIEYGRVSKYVWSVCIVGWELWCAYFLPWEKSLKSLWWRECVNSE